MKNWQPNRVGVIVLALVLCFSFSAFVIAKAPISNQVTSSVSSEANGDIRSDQVQILNEATYAELMSDHIGMRAANITDTATLAAYDRKQYSFDMSSLTSENHSGFTINISNLSSSGNVEYTIVIYEGRQKIYDAPFTKATTLKVKADFHSSYKVIVLNTSASNNSLTYTIKIDAYN